MEEEQRIFKSGSKAYYYITKLFPKNARNNVSRLYSFVHTADDYVDGEKPEPKKLLALEKAYNSAIADSSYDATAHRWDDQETRAVKHIIRLQHRFKFDDTWVKDFFSSMKMDLEPKAYKTMGESLQYVHGSAEVVGLMVAKVIKLPEESYEAAQVQARAIQWMNFIRDLAADTKRGRTYFPVSDLKQYGLKNLSEDEARAHPEKFKKFIRHQLSQYKKWQKEASEGLQYIPEHLKVPITTTIDVYAAMAKQIDNDPFVVFEKKVQPAKHTVAGRVVTNVVRSTTNAAVKAAHKIRSGTKQAVPAAKAAVPVVKEKAAEVKDIASEKTDEFIQKTEEIREKLPGSKTESK